ncbi:MAG: 16S rRNA (cytidine(1402)-2'-O)-methyltransferase [Streptosporangiaceae bacterium]
MNRGFHRDDAGQRGTGTLILAAAPIGRPQDASGSLAAALSAAPVIAAEDTRRLARLARSLGVTLAGRIVSYYEGVETERARVLLGALADGQDVLLITDAGTPGISDPGYRLVNTAIEAGVRVTVLPGPSAVTAALAVSGLPSDRFCFEGFPPRKAAALSRRLADLRDEQRTMVFFESPRRLPATLAQMATAFGAGRPAAVCRELTKTHEQIKRGPLGELAAWAADGVLGEITVVVGGAASAGVAAAASTQDIAAKVSAAEHAGLTRKEAMASVASETGLSRRTVYDAVIKAKADQPS